MSSATSKRPPELVPQGNTNQRLAKAHPSAREALFRFLACIYRCDDLVEVRPIPNRKRSSTPCKISDVRKWLRPHEVLAACDELTQLNAAGLDIFMGVNPRTRVGGGRKTDVAVCRSVWADLDHISVEQACLRWKAVRLPVPSVIVQSGRGVHLYWVLEEPYSVANAKSRELFEAMLKQLYADLGADATSDVSRLLRLPGFLNLKGCHGSEALYCRLVRAKADNVYALSTFASWLQLAHSSVVASQLPKTPQPPLGSGVCIQRLVERLDLPLRPKPHGRPDRSTRDFAIICELLKLGVSRDNLWELVRYKSKFATDGKRYFDLTVNAAALASNSLWAIE